MAIDDCSSLFATIRRFLPLFATIRHYSHYSGLFALFGTIRCSLFATIRYSLFGFSRHPTSLPYSGRRSPWPTQNVKYEKNHLMVLTMGSRLWNAICCQNVPKTIPVNTIKRFLVVDEIYMQLPTPLSTLLRYLPQCENLIRTSAPLAKSSLFVSQNVINSLGDTLYSSFVAR